MPNLDASLIKERIMSHIKSRGPSMPVQIAKAVNISPLFASAFLSELFGEQKLKMSHMKVGSSSLYHIEGQEPMLENFIEHLNGKEKEAFNLLKKEKVLEDEKQEPAIRVALRSIKDFEHPKQISSQTGEKIIWKYFILPDSEISQNLSKAIPISHVKTEQKAKEQKPEKTIEQAAEKVKETIKEIETAIDIKKEPKPKKKLKIEDLAFCSSVKDCIKAKDIEILSILSEKKKEFIAKVRIDTPLGKQVLLLTAKDKKKATEEDLALALQKAQSEKMPALLMTTGELDKKSSEEFKAWSNLVKFERLKL